MLGAGLLLFYMRYLTWCFFDKFNFINTLMSISFSILCLIPYVAVAVGVREYVVSVMAKGIVNALVALICIATIVTAYAHSIKKYRAEGISPNYAAFGIVCGYSILMCGACGSFLF